jgi:hypothetical protein
MGAFQPHFFVVGVVGLFAGAALFVRGLNAYRRGANVAAIATSATDSIAMGEVRLSGIVEPLAATLISPLQSAPAVWYRSRIVERGDTDAVLLDEERSVDFLLHDATGTVRVVPGGAHWEIAPAFDESTDLLGSEPSGLNRRTGAASMAVAEFDREAAIADLLTVRPPSVDVERSAGGLLSGGLAIRGGTRRQYVEARLEPGTRVTLVGVARPYGEIDPLGAASAAAGDAGASDDPAIAAELAAARAAGELASSAREAWGNAAIPGFGIGRPVETPDLETDARRLPAADPAVAARAERIFGVSPDTLVLTSGDTPLTVYEGTPAEAASYDRMAFLRGLAGGGLAAASTVVLAIALNGGW